MMQNIITVHKICQNLYEFVMRFWCTSDVLLMYFLEVYTLLAKVYTLLTKSVYTFKTYIKSTSEAHQKCIKNSSTFYLKFIVFELNFINTYQMHFNSQQDNTHFQVEWHPHVKCTYTKSQPEEKYTQVKPSSSKSNLTSSSKRNRK